MTRRDDFSQAIRYAAPQPLVAGEETFDAVDIVRLVRRRIWTIVGVAALVVALALPAIRDLQRTYTATSRLLIQNPLSTALASSAQERMVELNLTTEVERLLSRDMAADVIRTLGIDALPEFNPLLTPPSWLDNLRAKLRGALVTPPETTGPVPEIDAIDLVLPGFQSSLSVALEPGTDVVRIDFTSLDPALAAEVPRTLLRSYLSEGEANLARNVQRTDAWLADRTAEQKARLEAAMAAVTDFEEKSGLADADPRAGTTQSIATLTEMRADLARQRSELTATLSDVDKASSVADRSALIDSPAVAEVSRALRARKFELDRLLETHGSNHPDVSAVRADVEDLTRQLSGETDLAVQMLRSRLAAMGEQDASLARQLTAESAALSQRDALEARRDDLKRVAAAEQAVLDRLDEQSRALTAEGKLPVADVEILSPSTLPLVPNGRGRAFYLAAVLVAAGMLGMTAGCAVELFDRSVRSFQQLGGVPGLTPTALVPRLPRRVAGSWAALVTTGHEGMFGEAIRSVVHSLREVGNGRLPASLLVSSALPGEGKSTMSAALAMECAAGGQDVILVDADLAHGRLHLMLGVPQSPGLADYLRGDASLEDVIRHDPASGISFIAAGTPQPGRMRDDDRILKLIEFARTSDRMLIIDSAPVFASARTLNLAAVVDRSLLVMRWGHTSRHAAEQAARQLSGSFGRTLLGAINMVNPRRHALYGFKDSDGFSRSLMRYSQPRSNA